MTIKIVEGIISQTETDDYHTELFEALEAGYTVIAHAVYDIGDLVRERWCLKSPNGQQPRNTQVRAIVSIERTTTYSKTHDQDFDFWRCELDTGRKVNIFDHPDEKRNTYSIAQQRGYDAYFQSMDQGIFYEPDAPIPVTIHDDGEFYSLVDMATNEVHESLVAQYSQRSIEDIITQHIESETTDDE